MLAQLMPGFRHARTPLVAGALWLLLMWLVFGDDLIPQASDGRIEGRLNELAEMLGRPVILAALGLLALLLGSISPRFPVRWIASRLRINVGTQPHHTLSQVFGLHGVLAQSEGDFSTWLHRTAMRVPNDIQWSDFEVPECPAEMQVWARDLKNPELSGVRIRDRWVKKDELIGSTESDAPQGWLTWFLAPESIEHEVTSELPLRLQIERESLYNDYDRLRAEAQFRAAIIPPLVLLIAVMVLDSPLWCLAFAVPLWLVRQAVQSQVEADQRLRTAVRHGAVRSSTMEFLRYLTSASRGHDGALDHE